MTLIATFSIDGIPVLFGDLLLTAPALIEHEVSIPAMREAQDFFGRSGWSISGMKQKVNLVGPNCAIAWSGSWLGARMAIGELATRAKTRELDPLEILEYLHEEPELRVHQAAFVGLVRFAGKMYQFQVSADEFDSPSFGRVHVSGTGAPAIREFSDLHPKFRIHVDRPIDHLNAPIYQALVLGGMLLRSEIHGGFSAPTLRNMFGGGYEIAFDAGGRIKKLQEVTYVIWLVTMSPGGVAVSPQMIITQRYVGDYLLLRSARLWLQDGVTTIADDQRHVITPMFKSDLDVPLNVLNDFSLQSGLYCHCLLGQTEGSDIDIIGTMIRPVLAGSKLPMTFADESGSSRVSIGQDLINEIAQTVSRAAGESKAG